MSMRRAVLRRSVALVVAVLGLAVAAGTASAAVTVGSALPADFPVITDASLGVPVIGFGSAGPVTRTPVIFLHGNNDTPYPTVCNPYGDVQAFAQFFVDHGYASSEVWALGYQGDQCDLLADQTIRSGESHATMANVPDLRAFVRAVLDYTGAKEVDIVAHSLGVTLTRAWLRQDHAQRLVRRFVAIDGPNHGIINCSPSPLNYWQLPALGGFTPDSVICRDYGAEHTPLLDFINHGDETLGSTRYLVIRNADTSFVYFPLQDGVIAPVPAQDRNGNPHDFSNSARLDGAGTVNLTGQGTYDPFLGTAHLGILNSPDTRRIAFDYLTSQSKRR
jgi:pimeloyl-ACP methyl ester carboxylesterase